MRSTNWRAIRDEVGAFECCYLYTSLHVSRELWHTIVVLKSFLNALKEFKHMLRCTVKSLSQYLPV